MATNDFIGFASNGSANIMSQADYAATMEQGDGVQPGMASSALANKVWRQGANMAAALGELIKNHGIDALDNGDIATLYSALLSATASTTLAGWMSAADKTKLDGIDFTLGHWTPVFSAGGDITFANKRGRYWRYGDLVNVMGVVTATATTASPTGNLSFSGLPFVPTSYYGLKFMGSAYASGGVDDSFRRIVGCSVNAGNTPEVHFTVLSTTTPAKTRWYTSIGSNVGEFGVALTPSAGVFQLYFQATYWMQE